MDSIKKNKDEKIIIKINDNANILATKSEINVDDFYMNKGGELKKYRGKNVDVIIPSNVTSIGKNAFYKQTKLKSVFIPAGVTSIGELAFLGCINLTSITFESNSLLTRIDV